MKILKKMKKTKSLIFVLLTIALVFLLAGCGETTTPYETNNEDGYTVSVKFDANGGQFAANTTVMVDSFAPQGGEIVLIEPNNSLRGNDAMEATKNDCFLAGWYKERTEKTDENGEKYYVYSGKWDFENDVLKIDENKKYSADDPALTLYAVWVPNFEIEFYSREDGKLISTQTYNPMLETEYSVPAWNEKTGAIDMYNFPVKEGYTFDKAYFDIEGTKEVTENVIKLPIAIDEENPTKTKSVLKLYIDWIEGEWYHIYTAEQFKECASVNGNYEILADLDFTDEIWPTSLVYGNFSGVIKGNGHTFKNIEASHTNESKQNAGLFGVLTDDAKITDLNFENVTFTIAKGTRKIDTYFGLFAGKIADGAQLSDVKILSSHLKIDSSCYFMVDESDYAIGLVCGIGDYSKILNADIDCTPTGKEPEKVNITVSGNSVTVVFNKQENN